MKKVLIVSLFAILIFTLNPFEANAASNFDTTAVSTEPVAETPENLFNNPYLLYKGEGKYEGIEFWVEKDVVCHLPMDGLMMRDFLVINKSNNYLMTEEGKITLSGEAAQYTEAQLVICHPNPMNMKLAPGESQRGTITVDFGNKLVERKTDLSGKLGVCIELGITFVNDNYYDRCGTIKVNFDTKLEYSSKSTLNDPANRTATICGYVKNSLGKAISNAKVTIDNGFAEQIVVKTNSKGYYSAKVFAVKNEYYGTWHAVEVEVEAKNYATKNVIVNPKSNKKLKQNFILKKKSTAISYKETKIVNMGIQGNYFDTTANGKVLAAVPFHSALPEEEIVANSNLVIFNQTGSSVKKVALGAETPCVCISKDGKYIVSQFDAGREPYSTTVIFDASGNIVYQRDKFPSVGTLYSAGPLMGQDYVRIRVRAAAFSNDSNYLVVGSMDGDIYCIDWKNDRIVWTANARNQIRTIDYSENGSLLYITSGDGYMYCFTATGSMKWKTYIGSWGTCVSVSEHYVAVSVKSASYSLRLLDAQTGKQKFVYQTPGRGFVTISPDETMLFFGNDTSSAYAVDSSFVVDI